ncbi:hypothetical protein CA13_10130 [Planctomycetes bacterium CA13]|uniref:Uncharacterized protein n=1 Tax=Novipirellula herctigrandis TaxID=2527986 RepID=A0A5C5YX29_9BACT|nr:hypothetical protein CA13_10130 [Planctomycetes bacterium CA13]
MSTTSSAKHNSSQSPITTFAGESDAHRMSRHWQTAIRVILIALVVAAIVLFVFYRAAAYLAAIPIPILFVTLALLDYYEQRSRTHHRHKLGEADLSKQEIEEEVETAGIVMVLKVFMALALGTFIVAAAFFDWATVGIAATATLFLAILINLPYLLLGFAESERDEREKLSH